MSKRNPLFQWISSQNFHFFNEFLPKISTFSIKPSKMQKKQAKKCRKTPQVSACGVRNLFQSENRPSDR